MNIFGSNIETIYTNGRKHFVDCESCRSFYREVIINFIPKDSSDQSASDNIETTTIEEIVLGMDGELLNIYQDNWFYFFFTIYS